MPYRKFRLAKQFEKNWTFIFKSIYKARIKRKARRFYFPDGLLGRNVTLHDPNDPDFPRKTTPDPVEIHHPAFRKRSTEEEPLYKGFPRKPAFRFDGTESLSDGVNQALQLAKAVPRYDLGDSLLNSLEDMDFPEALDTQIQDFVMHAMTWDSTLVKLPKIHDPVIFWIDHPRVWGVPGVRKCEILFEDFYRHCLTFGGFYPNLRNDQRLLKQQPINATTPLYYESTPSTEPGRTLLADAPTRIDAPTPISRALTPSADPLTDTASDEKTSMDKEDKTVRFSYLYTPHLTVMSNKPLDTRMDYRERNETENEAVPDVTPIDPLIDLVPCQLYDDESYFPASRVWENANIHTVFVRREQDQQYPWTKNENLANAVMHAFGAALAVAKDRYPEYNARLPEPIVTQVIQITAHSFLFDFVVFQLNTLDFSTKEDEDNDKMKNVAWLDGGNQLFAAKPFWEQCEKVEDYNGDVFRKFLAMIKNT